ncbi:MAG TPA: hypothetical protein IAC36_08875 [Candidatus Aphodomonas merdavium]|nr:hypothetical protein [Candidatus Aphodomonas merdavium]
MKSKAVSLLKRLGGTLMLPLIMYFAMMILCYSNGKMYYGTVRMWRTLIVDIAVSVTCAMGIGLQFRSGRFDFSGGAIMLLGAIIAGNTAVRAGNNLLLMFLLCVVCCLALSMLVALFYVYARVPIIITTIGFALLYESVTCLIFDGTGINIISNMTLRVFSTYPMVLIPLLLAVGLYAFYCYFTTSGKQAVLLANNQQSAVNIGINERRNVLTSYVFSGLIFGFATVIWIAGGKHDAAYTSMSTVSELFSNILPVFIGLMVAGFCGDTIGTIVGAVTLCLLSYALNAVFANTLGTAISNICMGVFILAINVVSAQGRKLLSAIGKMLTEKPRRTL